MVLCHTLCNLWCRHCSDPTCNAGNASRLWFGLLRSGRDSLLSAERRGFHVTSCCWLLFTSQDQEYTWYTVVVRTPCSLALSAIPRTRVVPRTVQVPAPALQDSSTALVRFNRVPPCNSKSFFCVSTADILYSVPETHFACPCTWQLACSAFWSPPRPPPAGGCPTSSPTFSGQCSRKALCVTAFEGRLQLSSQSGWPGFKNWIFTFKNKIWWATSPKVSRALMKTDSRFLGQVWSPDVKCTLFFPYRELEVDTLSNCISSTKMSFWSFWKDSIHTKYVMKNAMTKMNAQYECGQDRHSKWFVVFLIDTSHFDVTVLRCTTTENVDKCGQIKFCCRWIEVILGRCWRDKSWLQRMRRNNDFTFISAVGGVGSRG